MLNKLDDDFIFVMDFHIHLRGFFQVLWQNAAMLFGFENPYICGLPCRISIGMSVNRLTKHFPFWVQSTLIGQLLQAWAHRVSSSAQSVFLLPQLRWAVLHHNITKVQHLNLIAKKKKNYKNTSILPLTIRELITKRRRGVHVWLHVYTIYCTVCCGQLTVGSDDWFGFDNFSWLLEYFFIQLLIR